MIASKPIPRGQIEDLNTISKTHAEMLALQTASQFVIGQTYLLSDYMTVYTQPVTGVTKSSGIIEPLYVIATSVNTLHTVCKSQLYPQDIIYYNLNDATEGFTKGKIFRRIDTLRNNDIGTDWRHVKYDRLGVDKLLFEDYTGCYNNYIALTSFENYGFTLMDTVVGSYFYSNTIGYGFNSNTIGYGFYSNTIGNDFYSNTIGNDFYSNTIGDYFGVNTIGNDFNSNTIVDSFNSNTIVDNFVVNTIGISFASNTIGISFSSNTIGNYFTLNTIGNDFTSNTIGDVITNKDFTTYTELYGKTYPHEIYLLPNNTVQYKWIDNFGDINIENIA